MSRFFVLLCVVFSLMFAPVPHAAEPVSPDSGHALADHSPSKKQDGGSLAAAAHHCIAGYVKLELADSALLETSMAFTIIAQTNPASITVGPLLEPPSRA